MKYFGIFIVLFSFFCCNPSVSDNKTISETNYGKIDDSDLKFKFGDITLFEDTNIKAVVIDIIKEDNKTFYGISFMMNDNIFGRRIPEGFEGNCVDLIDILYVEENYLTNKKIKVIKQENLNFKKIGIGAYGYINNYEEILSDYKKGIEIRKLEQTPCTNFAELNPIHDQYFDINQFK
ncbi:hypothetical protein [Empedobacter sedimenti]|uniref:hypothetical protein n=1 Tax=Empedobacter sedimenti TaxID=3042610 RepID=UPI0024A68E7C|nr:hypothetical protein [Empedobacter sedimenti]